MITRTDAERIAAAVNQLRPDWPVKQMITIIERRHTARAVIDLALALTYVALDRTADGRPASRTPARVDEHGPWWDGATTDPELEQYRSRERRDLEQRRAEHRARGEAIDACTLCDERGYLPTGWVCRHDPEATPERARARAQAARDAVQRVHHQPVAGVFEEPGDTPDTEPQEPDMIESAVPEYFTVVDNVLRRDGKGTHHAAIVGPGVLCRTRGDGLVAVAWEHGVANVDCTTCLQILEREQVAS